MDDFNANDLNILDQLIEQLNVNQKTQQELQEYLKKEGEKKKLSQKFLNYLSQESDLKRFVDAFQKARNVQICFMIDVTGSMSSYDKFKNNFIAQLFDVVTQNIKEGKKRYGYIGYRERNEKHGFEQITEDLDKVMKTIKNEKLTGGGDTAEDVQYAFELMQKHIHFRPGGTRILIHIADAPAHGSRYHDDDIEDNHPELSDNLDEHLLNVTSSMSCFYWFVKITKYTDKMIKEFDKILKQNDSEMEGFNEVKVLDLTKLKEDIRSKIDQIFKKTFLQSVKSI